MATAAEKETLLKWAKVVDNCKYLGVEYRHKEKEYGIAWRAEYKIEVNHEKNRLVRKFDNPLPGQEEDEDGKYEPLEVIEAIVLKHYADVQTFEKESQFDMIEIMDPTL